MSVRRLVGFVIVSGCLLLPTSAWPQAATGTIAGVVKDTSGAVLPGVTVEAASPVLIEKVRTVVSDERGEYSIIELRPGTYTITFSLPGFATIKREGIELTSSFTATVNAELRVGTLEETITVSGETPVVDTRSARQQTTVGRAVLDALPTTKRFGQYATFIPSVVMQNATQMDVGGTAGEGGRYAAHGQSTGDMVINVEGLNQNLWGTDVYSYNAHTIQEVVVETGGMSAEASAGGVQVNIVTKEGGNTFSGTYSGAYTGPSLQASNLSDALRGRGLQVSKSLKAFRDNGGALGGPILRDKLWFFGAIRYWGAQRYIQGNYYNKRQGTLFYEPDYDRPAYTDWYYHDDQLRLTWQATQKQKIAGSFSLQDSCNGPVGLSGILASADAAMAAPEARAKHVFNPMQFAMASWNYPATNKLLFEAVGSRNKLNEDSQPMDPVGPNDISVTDVGMNIVYGSVAGGSGKGNNFWGTYQERYVTSYTGRFAASYVTGPHIFKSGFTYRRYNRGRDGAYNDINAIHGARSYTFRNQVPNAVTIWAVPFELMDNSTNIGAYVQDQWAIKKLTLNLGLRFDALNAWAPAYSMPAGIFVPERRFPAVKNVPDFKDLNPRVSVIYDLFGDGKTALKASLGRFVPFFQGTVTSPSENQAGSVTRNWNDANRNYVPDCDLRNQVANGECGAWGDLTFGQVTAGNIRFADDALTGFGTQYNNWQGSVSLQQELRPGVALNVGYFHTRYGNFQVTKNEAVTLADFDEFCITLPATDSRLPNAGQQLCGFYNIKPEKFGLTNNLRTLASDYGKRTEVYNGADVTLTARFAQGAQFSGGLTVGRTVTDACDIAAKTPEGLFGRDVGGRTGSSGYYTGPGLLSEGAGGSWSPLRSCKVTPPWSNSTQARFLVVYPLPWNLQASAVYQNIPGIPITATYAATNAEIRPGLGRDLGSCRGAATCNATLRVELIQPGTQYEDRLQQVDVRLSRRFQFGRFKVAANLDVSNLFNDDAIYSANIGFGPRWLVPYEVMGGRLARFSTQIDF